MNGIAVLLAASTLLAWTSALAAPGDVLTLDVDASSGQAPPPAAHSEEDLAKKLQNPLASLISVPFQYNADFNIGPQNGTRQFLHIQPVIPFSLNQNWNLITRTIVPVIYQDDVVNDGGSTQFGFGDITQSFWLSPSRPTAGGLVWGVGPVFLWPTATNDSLGSERWGIGPTGVFLRQHGPWTVGLLANHIWSYAGDSDRGEVNSTFLQPFLTHTWKNGFTLGINTESTYDWSESQWTVPVNVYGSHLVKFGNQPVQFTLGGRYYAEGPSGGPEWGLRFAVTLLFPK